MTKSFLFKDIKHRSFYNEVVFSSMKIHRYTSISKTPFKRPCNIRQLSNIWTNSTTGATKNKLISNSVNLTIWKSSMTKSSIFKIEYTTKSSTTRLFLFKWKVGFIIYAVYLYKNYGELSRHGHCSSVHK